MVYICDCPSCGAPAYKLVIYQEPKKLGCPACGTQKPKSKNVNLNQTVQSWVGPKGQKHRLTSGKSWEIENRVISKEDPNVVINKVTGKPTEL